MNYSQRAQLRAIMGGANVSVGSKRSKLVGRLLTPQETDIVAGGSDSNCNSAGNGHDQDSGNFTQNGGSFNQNGGGYVMKCESNSFDGT